MNTREITTSDSPGILAGSERRQAPLLDRILRKRLLDMLKNMRGCRIVLDENGETHVLGLPAAIPAETLLVHIHIHDSAFYRQVALNGLHGRALGLR